jgi:hypothetical protein
MIRIVLATASFIAVVVAPLLVSEVIWRLNKPPGRK